MIAKMRAASGILAAQSPRMAQAVPSFVMGPHDLDGAREEPDRRDDLRPDRGMLTHHGPLRLVEGTSLAQHRFEDPHLADVVQEESVPHLGTGCEFGVDALGEGEAVSVRAIEMATRGGVLGLDHLGERRHRRHVHVADPLERLLELEGAGAFGLVERSDLPREDNELCMDGGKFGVARHRCPRRPCDVRD